MKRFGLWIITLICALECCAAVGGRWQLHPPFAYRVINMAETPKRVYMLAQAQPVDSQTGGYSEDYNFLYTYDKDNQSLTPLTRKQGLGDDIIDCMAYNSARGYLLVAYRNGKIDLIGDDESISPVRGLESASIAGSKRVNDISFQPDAKRAWLATDFGWIEINDEKSEIADSRRYNTPLYGVYPIDDWFIVFTENQALAAPISKRLTSLSDFSPIEGIEYPRLIMPFESGFAFTQGNQGIFSVRTSDEGLTMPEKKANGTVLYRQEMPSGWFIAGDYAVRNIDDRGKLNSVDLAPKDRNKATATRDFIRFWTADSNGLGQLKREDENWSDLSDALMPNSPRVFTSRSIAAHPEKGEIALQHGVDRVFTGNGVNRPLLLDAYDGSSWQPIDFSGSPVMLPNGIALDPDNPDIAYVGSYYSGLVRFDITGKEPTMRFSQPADPAASESGFHAVVPTQSWREYCNFAPPRFDAEGNLWTAFHEYEPSGAEGLWVWPADARKAGNAGALTHFEVENYEGEFSHIVLPLKHKGNRNLVLLTSASYEAPLLIIDHAGTLDDASDDRVFTLSYPYDRDGGAVGMEFINCLYEDPDNGRVWVGTSEGVFNFLPTEFIAGSESVERPKVARNDGTNLADYLLDGVPVNAITDMQGLKWFATDGAGLICTAADGSRIVGSWTTENSDIPANSLYALGASNDDKTLMVSTGHGLASFTAEIGTGGSGNEKKLIVYPNPARPDYLGWIHIEGLEDGARVKITDAAGKLVKDLGETEGGSTLWNATDGAGRTVVDGVYHIFASGSNGEMRGKVLIINPK